MDFSAFDKQYSGKEYLSEMVARIRHYRKTHSTLSKGFAVIAIISVLTYFILTFWFGVYSLIRYFRNNDIGELAVVIVALILILSGVLLCRYVAVNLMRASLRMQDFARQNNLEFFPEFSVGPKNGHAFSPPVHKFGRNGVKGHFKGFGFSMFEYRFITGTGRHPYPNIFTVVTLNLGKPAADAVLVNKKGRLKIISRPRVMKKRGYLQIQKWSNLNPSVRLYSKGGKDLKALGGCIDEKDMQRLLDIYPKTEVQMHGQVLSLLLAEKFQPNSRLASDIFQYLETVLKKV